MSWSDLLFKNGFTETETSSFSIENTIQYNTIQYNNFERSTTNVRTEHKNEKVYKEASKLEPN